MNKQNLIIATLIGIFLVVACSGNQQDEANKLGNEANQKLEEAKAVIQKTEERNDKLFSVDVNSNAELQNYKARVRDEAKSIVKDYEKASEMIKDVSGKFEQISKMKVPDKYKEYAKLKADAFAKRAEALNIRKGNAQSFLDLDDITALQGKFKENNTKSEQLFKDADDLNEKAHKIEEENKEVFKDTK